MSKLKANISSFAGILIGSTIMAAGFVFFINPYNFVPGGIYGASIVMHNLFPSIQVGTFGYMFDVPLLILSVILLGGKLGARTLLASLYTPLAMNVISKMVFPTQEALETLNPSLMLGGILDMTNHLMLACVIGSVIPAGIGTAVKGISDIVADSNVFEKLCRGETISFRFCCG